MSNKEILPKPQKPVIVTYWWGNGEVCKNTRVNFFTKQTNLSPVSYPHMVNSLKQQANRYGFEFDTEELQKPGGYQKAISYKPIFILKMLNKWKRPVIYLDCDMKIHKAPVIFTTNQYDFMAFNWNADTRVSNYKSILFDWNVLETSGGIFYFNYTQPAMRLLKEWSLLLKVRPSKADDRLLSIAFMKTNAIKYLRFYWIPMEYFYVPQYYYKTIPHRNVVISHSYSLTDEDDAQKLAGTTNRVPKEYDRLVARKAKHHKYIVEINNNKTLIKCITNRNRHMIKQGISYHLNDVSKLDDAKYLQIIN